jgi:hypothetical protein
VSLWSFFSRAAARARRPSFLESLSGLLECARSSLFAVDFLDQPASTVSLTLWTFPRCVVDLVSFCGAGRREELDWLDIVDVGGVSETGFCVIVNVVECEGCVCEKFELCILGEKYRLSIEFRAVLFFGSYFLF